MSPDLAAAMMSASLLVGSFFVFPEIGSFFARAAVRPSMI